MERLKLFMVSHMFGETPCWQLIVAKNHEEAILKCFNKCKHPQDIDSQTATCKVEEVKNKGYNITITEEKNNPKAQT